MPQTVTLVLLLASEPTRSERALLDAYAQKQHAAFVAPAPTPPPVYAPYRADRVLAIEGRIDEARTFASSLDEERALELLAAIEQDLLQHPELPQAAWLMAERHTLTASVRRAQPDGARDAEELVRRARVLEGPRAPAFGETAAEASRVDDSVRVHFPELAARDVLEVDGVKSGATLALAPGEHHVRVLRNGELLFAGWSALGGAAEARLGVRPLTPCSAEDLFGIDARAASPGVPPGVHCASFVVARRRGRQLEVAACQRRACRPFEPLLPERAEARTFPPWAAIALAGVAAAGVTSLVLWSTGALDREEPPAQREFVYRGLGP
jgi:hypothetical protein